MPLEMAMLKESLEDVVAIESALQQMWEPFTIYKGEIYFRRIVQNEDREARSSTKPENKVIWTPEDQ